MKTTVKRTVQLLIAQQKTLAVAESFTGGLIAHSLTNIPGSSQYFTAAVIAYSNTIKQSQLKIPKKTIEKNGAVSKEVAIAMAKNIRRLAKTDFGISTTGIAGPTGATKTKPVGLAFIALAIPSKTTVRKFVFKGTRCEIKKKAAEAALRLLYNYLKAKT
ncbi:CinA family protein [Candidatus Omnitrophota bacterium]